MERADLFSGFLSADLSGCADQIELLWTIGRRQVVKGKAAAHLNRALENGPIGEWDRDIGAGAQRVKPAIHTRNH